MDTLALLSSDSIFITFSTFPSGVNIIFIAFSVPVTFNSMSSPVTVFSPVIVVLPNRPVANIIFPSAVISILINSFSNTLKSITFGTFSKFIGNTSVCSTYVLSYPNCVISIVCVLSFSSGNMYLLGVCTSVNTYFPGIRFSLIIPSSFVVTTLNVSPSIFSSSPTGFPSPSVISCPCSSVIVNLTPLIGTPFVSCFIIFSCYVTCRKYSKNLSRGTNCCLCIIDCWCDDWFIY